ncbi:MAG: D-aminoacyl-tRNA deacylase [Planctomycetota bacterium]
MRIVIQRVTSASVEVDQQVVSSIQKGLLVLVGVAEGDDNQDAKYLAEKVVGLRIFGDEDGKMNLSLKDVEGKLLAVSQFTLCGDVRKGRRPSFVTAAKPDEGNRLYMRFVNDVREQGVDVATGIFQADMKVSLVNDGPVTILIDSKKSF